MKDRDARRCKQEAKADTSLIPCKHLPNQPKRPNDCCLRKHETQDWNLMRIVTWNCKEAFHRKHAAVAALRPDILVVQESESFTTISAVLGSKPMRTSQWIGDNPRKGLGVIAYGDYSFELHPAYNPQHKWVLPLRVFGPIECTIFAVWMMPHPVSASYVQPLIEAFEDYRHHLDDGAVLLAGDFNAGFVFDRPRARYKFQDFVSSLEQRGILSLYHKQRKCPHGQEPESTFFLYHHVDKTFHIDYIFGSSQLHASLSNVEIGSYGDWNAQSDHMPLICDL